MTNASGDPHSSELWVALLDVIYFQEEKEADMFRIQSDFDEFELPDFSEVAIRRGLAALVRSGDLVRRGDKWAITSQGIEGLLPIVRRNKEQGFGDFLSGEKLP